MLAVVNDLPSLQAFSTYKGGIWNKVNNTTKFPVESLKYFLAKLIKKSRTTESFPNFKTGKESTFLINVSYMHTRIDASMHNRISKLPATHSS